MEVRHFNRYIIAHMVNEAKSNFCVFVQCDMDTVGFLIGVWIYTYIDHGPVY